MLMQHFLQRLHFVGIGGAGMSAIAELLHLQGLQVSGSDAADSPTLRRLASLGLRVHPTHDAAHLGAAQALVCSSAIPAENPELQAARARGLPVLARAQMLAELMRGRLGVAVAGTHGKTTTTSLIASVLLATGAEPGYAIGGELLLAGGQPLGGAALGRGPALVVEADESDASFLQLQPLLAVVTNIDEDHMSTYGHSRQRLQQAFIDFIHRLPFYGRAIVCSDDPGMQAVLPQLQRPLLRYGLGADAELRAVDVQAGPGLQMRFVACQSGHPDLPVTLALAGEHNVRNALAAIAVARLLRQPEAPLQQALARFGGAGRRLQPHGELPCASGGSYLLLDDYGHHPAELAAVLAAARGAWPGRRLLAVFQPHRYSRTRDCLADFAAVLARFDAVLLTEVYAAGEAPLPGADGAALAAHVPGARFVPALADLPAALRALVHAGDVVLTLGAGSIARLPGLLKQPEGAST